jgi:PAS domain S-box-containing protein
MSQLGGDRQSFLRICDAHSNVLPAESFSGIVDPSDRLAAIAHLQQKASALEDALARSRELSESLSRLAAIVECSDDAIIGKTLDGRITSWNPGAERLFGYDAGEMIGQPINRIIPPDRPDDYPELLDTIRAGRRVEHYETERVRKDGRRIHVSLTVSPIRDADGRIVGASKIARDVSARRELEAQRDELLGIAQRARAEAETASRTKDEFLAMLSHELRNPLAALRNAVYSARLDGGRRERALAIASRQTEQLGRLVDDLLDLSRIARGRIRLNRQRVSFGEIVERALETVRPFIDERGHLLSVSPSPDPVEVEGDPARLEQVVVNLLLNAARYTNPGGRIALTLERLGGEAVLRVRDDGTGIAPDVLPRIFDLFVQAGRDQQRAVGGLGIGLAVVRDLVALHGGRVEAHSEGLGRGAEFSVHLPCVDAPAQPKQPAFAGEAYAPDGARRRVLVVEDNVDAAEGLMMLLEVFGHEVRVARDGESALEAVRAEVPDLMLVDIGLPGLDGYEVARRARRRTELRDVPMVALTGFGQEEDRQRALAAGFDQHLTKPVDPVALRALLARVGSPPE